MKFTLSWLKHFLKTEATPKEISDALNAIGLEVEEVIDKGKIYKPFLICEILETSQHPNAEKLKVCKVTTGKETLQIVCGASNAKAGLKTVLAPIGAIIPANHLQIKASVIRGIESFGMLCSANELMLEEENGGIIELPLTAQVGMNFAEHASLNEVVVDISITPNRGDAASVYGVARDLASKGLGELEPVRYVYKESSNKIPIDIKIEDKLNCTEFAVVYGKNINNQSKHSSFTAILETIGSPQKTPLVEVSNYAMLTLGRPNHIYDADKIKGSLVVRPSIEGEKFLALNGLEYNLPAGILVISDDEKVLSIAGVIGGELSKVDKDTKNILIEVANFTADAVINSGRKLNIHTDSRFRFERRVDYSNSLNFINFLCSLVQQVCGGELSNVNMLHNTSADYLTTLKFDLAYVKKILGIDLPKDEVFTILGKLGFKQNNEYLLIPPHRQGDIQGIEDVVEEVIRLYGFDKIPAIELKDNIVTTTKFSGAAESPGRNLLINRGLNEVLTWSFVSPNDAALFSFGSNLEISNPISAELTIMRESILPNLLSAMQKNEARGISNTGLFEIGNIYADQYPNKQSKCIAAIRFGKKYYRSVHKEERNFDFFDVKSDLTSLVDELGFDSNKLTLSNSLLPSYYHPGRSAAFKLGNKVIAYCGEVHPLVSEHYDASGQVTAFELFVDRLPENKSKFAKPKIELSAFQAVSRDYAFIIDKETPAAELVKLCKQTDPLINEIQIFDVYEGPNIAQNKKSIALNVKIQPKEKTFSDSDINIISEKLIREAQARLGATLR